MTFPRFLKRHYIETKQIFEYLGKYEGYRAIYKTKIRPGLLIFISFTANRICNSLSYRNYIVRQPTMYNGLHRNFIS